MFIRERRQIGAVRVTLCLAAMVLSSATAHGAGKGAEPVTSVSKHATIPAPRIDDWWFARQAEHIGLMKKGDIDLLMVGDSIMQNFENEKAGLKVWEKHFASLKAINLGAGGDRTQHVLWRLDHLPVMKKAPKGAVVLIGTNNMGWGSDTPQQTGDGIKAIVLKLKELYPDMDVLVLGVLPRRRKLDHPHRKRIIELNALLPDLLKGMKGVKFMDIGPAFLDEAGFLSPEMMPDGTHPSEKGHEVLTAAIMPELKRMLGTASIDTAPGDGDVKE
jgi:lysophospholipase L1-like esterase